jgi:hypothetical protein
MTPQEIQTLRALVEKWRIASASIHHPEWCDAKERCADELADMLDTLLAHSPSETPQAREANQGERTTGQ